MSQSTAALDAVLAQPTATTVLRRAIDDDKLASAYLFEGPGGVGKERLAMAVARAVLGEAAWTRIDAGAHPDVRIFRPREEGSRNLPVEVVREEILPVASFAPFEAAHAFLIFPEADVSFPEAHAAAANALLKTLEEPRPNVHFVLASERPERLLPTIRSRTQRLRLSPLPAETLTHILALHGHTGPSAEAAIALASGRADRALALAEDGAAEALLDRAARFDATLGQPKPGDLVDLADELAKDAALPLMLETLTRYYRDVGYAAVGLGDDALGFPTLARHTRRRAQAIGAGAAATRVRLLADLGRRLERNQNRGLALDSLIAELRAAR